MFKLLIRFPEDPYPLHRFAVSRQAIIDRPESADWIGVSILNVFIIGSQWTLIRSLVESADSGLELADSSANSSADPAKVDVWVWALKIFVCDISSF